MNKNIKIIDNFLSEDELTKLQSYILSNEFPWFYHDQVVGNEVGEKESPDNFQFVHNIYYLNKPNSSIYPQFIEPMFVRKLEKQLNLGALIRIKSNLTLKTKTINEILPYHWDFSEPQFKKSFTAVYYLNTNNGYTKFEDGTKIESVENKFVIFPTYLKHTNATPSNTKTRVVIVFNYF
tara:strand:- start:1458 stop:1994 length:537 start_codon:yes stop_codon:yes gene_type:complete